MISFFINIYDHLLGLSIGILVGSLLAILICAIIKQLGNKIVTTILIVATALLGGITGYWIQDKYFIDHSKELPTPQEQVKELDKNLKEGWTNANGGWTFAQIDKAQSDSDCPTIDDRIINMNCYNFDPYIVFSFYDNDIYQNILFYKSTNGLILDGMINVTADMEVTGFWIFKSYKIDTFKWIFEQNVEPYYNAIYSWLGSFQYDNLVSISRQEMKFVKSYASAFMNSTEATSYSIKQANKLTADNATSHFIKFDNVELIGSAETSFRVINSYYNYLYSQVYSTEFNSTKLIDSTQSMCVPIPEDKQSQYPIPEDSKADYGNAEYYGVYRCDIAVNLTYKKGNKTIEASNKNKEYIKKISGDEKTKDLIKVDKVDSKNIYSKVDISFRDIKNSNLINLNLANTPINITFASEDKKQIKVIKIDSLTKLNDGLSLLFFKDKTWTYLIDSQALVFDNARGSFNLTSTTNKLTFDYYYLNGYIVASVGLNPVGTVDQSLFDLSVNPVKIVLTNTKSKKTTEFTFNNNNMLNTRLSQLLELGEYTYSILSDKLIFASSSGTITITQTDRVMLFNYALNSDVDNYTFTVVKQGKKATSGIDIFSNDTNILEVLKADYPLLTVEDIKIGCTIYSSEQKILIDKISSTRVDGTTTMANDISSLAELDDYYGQTLTIQLKIQLSNGKLFLSTPFDFTQNIHNGVYFEFNFTID